ncbi:hypothetical protein CEXT_653681 [Caerostris extrusa]|uniref:Uncharacterized protein n=1 Tax=Caerostris extrusa TaxID=172846 RepID=A0AAV4NAE0_CAEEX|nr:hypothetical protein CEXT_653681 [Caerostris extrusa]
MSSLGASRPHGACWLRWFENSWRLLPIRTWRRQECAKKSFQHQKDRISSDMRVVISDGSQMVGKTECLSFGCHKNGIASHNCLNIYYLPFEKSRVVFELWGVTFFQKRTRCCFA